MNKRILNLAIPNIISNLSIPILSSVDTIIMGHQDEVYYLGAVSVGAIIFNFIYFGLNFLRMGTTGLTAQAYGKKDKPEAMAVLSRALVFAVITGLILILLQSVIREIGFSLIDTSEDVRKHAIEYYNIRIFAAPAVLALMAIHGWYLGVHNAKILVVLSILIQVSNAGLNILFVYGFGMKSDGIALGTVIAQYIGITAAILVLTNKYSDYLQTFKITMLKNISEIKKFFKMNADLFIRTIVLIFAFNYFTAKSALYGDNILAANSILIQLWMIISFGIDGFAFAAESLVGSFVGAKDKSSLVKLVKLVFLWGAGIGLLFSLAYFFFEKPIISIYTSNEEVIALCSKFFIWTIFAPFINSFCFIWDGIYTGATATSAMRNSMLISLFVFYFPIMIFTEPYLGNNALWLSMTGLMIGRGITMSYFAKRHVFQLSGV